MSCIKPIHIKGRYSIYRGVMGQPLLADIPCGRCLSCRLDEQKLWSNRLTLEWTRHKYCAFVTLTYDNPHVPLGKGGCFTVSRAHAHKYLDLLRHEVKYHKDKYKCGADPHFKYFLVSEYGDKTHRPHYHILFFGLDFEICKKLFSKYWKKGHVDVRPIQRGAIRYLLKYLNKQQHFASLEDLYMGREPPFRMVSNGLGKEVFLEHIKDIEECGMLRFGQRLMRFPSYWRDKYARFTPKLIESMEKNHERYQKKLAATATRLGFRDVNTYQTYLRRCKEKGLIARARRDKIAVRDLLTPILIEERKRKNRLSTPVIEDAAYDD